MKFLEIAALGIRLAGIILLIDYTADIPSMIIQTQQLFDPAYTGTLKVMWFSLVFSLLLCLFLIKFPVTIAKLIMPRTSADSPVINFDERNATITGFTVLGVYILTWSSADFFGNFLDLYSTYRFSPHDSQLIFEIWMYQVSTIFEMSIGLYLAVGSGGLYRLIQNLRGRG